MAPAPIGVGNGRGVQHADHPFDDIVDVGEIPAHLAVVEDLDRFSLQNGAGELEEGHVRTAPRAVHGEKTQPRGGDAEEVAVGVRHQLVGLLGGRIEAHRVIHVVMHRKRQAGIGAIHRAAGGIDQMLHPMGAASLQNLHESGYIAVDVGLGIFQGIAHPGLGRQMHHPHRPEALEHRPHRRAILQGDAGLRETGVSAEPGQPVFLQADVVVGIHVVQPGHRVAPLQQPQGQRIADETGRAGNEDLHRRGINLGFGGRLKKMRSPIGGGSQK